MKNNKTSLTIWILTIIVLTISTLVKTPFYDKWWFVALLFVFAAMFLINIFKEKIWKNPAVFGVHVSVLLILLGGFLTFTTSQNGNVHLTENEPVNTFSVGENQVQMPFYVNLKKFDVVYYPGTMSHADYVSYVELSDNGSILKEDIISMNNIMKYNSFRFFNEDFDEDLKGCTLTVQHDPWGILVTYIGYVLFIISMLVIFVKKITKKYKIKA